MDHEEEEKGGSVAGARLTDTRAGPGSQPKLAHAETTSRSSETTSRSYGPTGPSPNLWPNAARPHLAPRGARATQERAWVLDVLARVHNICPEGSRSRLEPPGGPPVTHDGQGPPQSADSRNIPAPTRPPDSSSVSLRVALPYPLTFSLPVSYPARDSQDLAATSLALGLVRPTRPSPRTRH